MKYLKKFESFADYSAAVIDRPNVCLVGDTIYYNPPLPPDQLPLYIEAIDNIAVVFTNACEYSRDNISWASLAKSASVKAAPGEKIYYRATGLTNINNDGIGAFRITTGNCNVGGNIMSMVYGADFEGKTQLTLDSHLAGMFAQQSTIIDASKLILPATTLTSYCYASLFSRCTNLIKGPTISAITLVSNCLYYAFYGCTNLSYIKALFKTTPGTSYTQNWLSGVAANGIFVKNREASWTTTGVNGVPTGWTVETAKA